MVRDRERWMTVGVPPKQPGLLTGQRFLSTRAHERSTWSVLRRKCLLLFPEEMFTASTAPPPFATIHSRL